MFFLLPIADVVMLKAPSSGGPTLSGLDLDKLLALVGGVFVVWMLVLVIRLWRHRRAAPKKWIVVDGSNVMHWKGQAPQISTVKAVVESLQALGFGVGVVFDANVGYKIGDRYLDDREMARKLGLPEARVLVVPKGTPADPYLLNAARDLGARVITRDRFRDWAEAHPEVKEPGFLIRGGYRDSGELWLDEVLPAQAAPVA